jgi:hypothetical protein
MQQTHRMNTPPPHTPHWAPFRRCKEPVSIDTVDCCWLISLPLVGDANSFGMAQLGARPDCEISLHKGHNGFGLVPRRQQA